LNEIKPQSGPQEQFMSSSADIAIFGGAAGCGKSYALLMEPLRHMDNKDFGAVVFRRTMPQITTEGGLWETAKALYTNVGADFIQGPLRATFSSGSKVEFHHLQFDDTVRSWDGSQIPLILFDELQHFTEYQFFYMLSRNRTTCGIRPYIRGTCNPDPDSFLRQFLSWWIDEEGWSIPERSGVIRYMVRIKNKVYWDDSAEALIERFVAEGHNAEDIVPKSVTFIPALLDDNPALVTSNPEYKANLLALPEYEQQRLLRGNWNARPKAGDLFKRSDFNIVETVPGWIEHEVRYWDRAATEQTDESPNPDWTCGVKIARNNSGQFIITDCERFRKRPLGVKQTIQNIASQDGTQCKIGLARDPGQAGIAEAEDLVRSLAGYDVEAIPEITKKFLRWKPLSAQVQAGNVMLLRGAWNEDFILELTNVTDNPKDYDHDDQCDAASGAFNMLVQEGFSDATVGHALAQRGAI
jgi:predicted phage terminase large subunit-like protein